MKNIEYKKPSFFKLGDVAELTKGSGSKNTETIEVGACCIIHGSYSVTIPFN